MVNQFADYTEGNVPLKFVESMDGSGDRAKVANCVEELTWTTSLSLRSGSIAKG